MQRAGCFQLDACLGASFRKSRLRRASSLVLAAAFAATPVLAQDGWLSRSLSAVNESSSVGMLAPGERTPGWTGWFSDAWEGSRRIFRDGHSDLLLPLYAWHPAYAYPNRREENSYPWGAGVARTVIDGKDNERIVYALGFSDSHYDFQPVAGYGWIARWPLGAGLKGGLGYTVFVSARSDAHYIPFPAALPLASIGNDRFTLYGSWIPSTDVVFIFARISLDSGERGASASSGGGAALSPGIVPGADGRFRANLLYGAGAWVNTDASGDATIRSGNAWAPLAGYRHFVTRALAMDLSVARSRISLDLNGGRLGMFDLIPISLAGQYHFPPYGGVRMYAGAGIAYNKLAGQDLPGYSLSGGVSPVLQAGVSVAVTDALVLTGGLDMNFARIHLSQGGSTVGSYQLSPVTFSLGVGYAF